jgi:putative hydrolase of the HAD superfamily
MTVEAFIFDFGGVIIPGSPSIDDPDSPWARLEREHGLPGGAVWNAIYLENAAWLELRVGRSSFDEWRATSVANLARLASPAVAETAVAAFWAERENLAAPPSFNAGMVELVTLLRDRYRVGLLSNAAPGLEDELRGHYRIYDLFHDVINSATVGLAKPDPAIFALAARRIGVPAARCFFVDDLAHNVAAAREAGMQAHRFLGYDGLVAELRSAGLALD